MTRILWEEERKVKPWCVAQHIADIIQLLFVATSKSKVFDYVNFKVAFCWFEEEVIIK